jgi:large subunit ribosomal protein L18
MRRTHTPHHARLRRHVRVRKKVQGTADRPRLSVYRSLTHIYAQVIDDEAGRTVAAASDVEAQTRDKLNGKSKTEAASIVGEVLAARARDQGVRRLVFDRGGYRYHGRVKALAEAARKAGLEF